jgi:hypothetical protein
VSKSPKNQSQNCSSFHENHRFVKIFEITIREAQNLANFSITTIDEDMIQCRMKVYASMCRIASFINSKLFSFPFATNKTTISENLMGNRIVKSHLPQYHLPPNEAKAQNALVQGLKVEVQEVKGVQFPRRN